MDKAVIRMCIPATPVLVRGVARKDSLWKPGDMISISFQNATQFQIDAVRQFSTEWLEYANLSFLFRDGNDGQIRISFRPGSSWSMVGADCLTAIRGSTMNLGWVTEDVNEVEVRRVILHEFGHAIGLEHEHQSPKVKIPWDKRAVYKWAAAAPNWWDRQMTDVNFFQKIEAERVIATEFDADSVMLYPVPPELTGGKMNIDWRNNISRKDGELVSQIYPIQESNNENY